MTGCKRAEVRLQRRGILIGRKREAARGEIRWRFITSHTTWPPVRAFLLLAVGIYPASDACPKPIRTARARTSGEYGGLGLVMAPSFQDQEPPENPVRFTVWAWFEEGTPKVNRSLVRTEPAVNEPIWIECLTKLLADSGRAFGPADCGRGQAQANGLVPASSAAGEAVQLVRSISPA